jgi:tagatose 1,6-diphosphate aldolase
MAFDPRDADPRPLDLGRLRGLQACSSPSGRFVVLAMDHRRNLRRELRPSAPDSVTDDELVGFKRDVVSTLGPRSSAVLLDPEYGLAQCLVARAVPGSVGLVVALEATGYVGSPEARRSVILDGWGVEAARRAGADAVKLLVYYHPAAPTAPIQEDLVATTVEACRRLEVALFLEVLVYALEPGRALSGAERRSLVVEAAHRLGAFGPDVLKCEVPADPGDPEVEIEAACRELDDAVGIPWTLLSGGVSPARFERLVEIACETGASGVVVGRAVWGEATRLAGPERQRFLGQEAVARIGRLTEIVERAARPWWARHPLGSLPEPPPNWYRVSPAVAPSS